MFTTETPSSPSSILLIVRKLPPQTDGVGHYTARLASALAERGHAVAILSSVGAGAGRNRTQTSQTVTSPSPLPSPPGPPGRGGKLGSSSGDSDGDTRNTRAAILPLPAGEGRGEGGVDVMERISAWNVFSLGKVIAAFRETRAEIVVLQFSPFMYGKRGVCLFLVVWSLCLRWLCGARVAITFHELYNTWGRTPLQAALSVAHRFQFFALGLIANELIFTTECRCRLGKRWFAWKRDRVRCVPVGANIEPVSSTAQQMETAQRRYRGDARHLICTFGMLQRGVCFEQLLQTFAALVREDRLDARLLFLGDWSNGELTRRQKLQSLVSALGLTERVVWSGPQSDETVSRLLSISDLYVCYRADGPTTRSGTLAAALAHGLPVLANRSLEPDPAFANGETVMLFDDASDLRRKCRLLLNDPALRARVSQRARKFARATLSWQRIAEGYEEAWNDANPKSEIRNPKQTRMSEIRNAPCR